MFYITKSIHVDFAHIVYGHSGLCAGPHGHTWRFEITLAAESLDKEGFVADFSKLRREVLQPIHDTLDHAFAMDSDTFARLNVQLLQMSDIFHANRVEVHGLFPAGKQAEKLITKANALSPLFGCRVVQHDAVKVVVFEFRPTSELLAHWFHSIASAWATITYEDRVKVASTRVFETLHPVESCAEYRLSPFA